MSRPQTRRWSDERRHIPPSRRGVRAASVVLLVLVAVLLGVTIAAAISAGLFEGFTLAGGWR